MKKAAIMTKSVKDNTQGNEYIVLLQYDTSYVGFY